MIDLKSAVQTCRAQILLDLDASDFRWPDVLMVQAANWVILEMLNRKPILAFSAPNTYAEADDFLIPEGALSNGGTFEVAFPSRYREAFVHGLAARCFNGDAHRQTEAARMAVELQRFNDLMAL